jgi:KDO2-lipid IV(A) lauroyltransferase
MSLISAVFFIFFIFIIGIIPFFFLYKISDFVRFLLFRVFKYRRSVVEQNLHETFPNFSPKEIEQITSKFYTNLSDVLIEGVKAFSMTRKQVMKRHKLLNPEVIAAFYEQGRSVIGTPCHYGNWEWGSMSGSIQLPQSYVVFYKPLNNKWNDKIAKWSRAKYNSQLVSIYNTVEVFEEHVSKNSIFIMAADQNPSNVSKAIWVDFFGRETAFLHGPELYARKYNLPVVFVDIQRVKRGFYELKFDVIAENPANFKEGEITQLYAKKLEAVIKNKPEDWLWSHRRWKHER